MIKVSKLMSYILRHNPEKFSLEMDRHGFVDFGKLISVIREKFPFVTKELIAEIVNSSTKRRFEIIGNKIRAVYGHTIDVDLQLKEIEPPEILFHGTSRKSAKLILRSGLKPMKRLYAHLSNTPEEAYQVGLRKDKEPVILKIKAKNAYNNGIKFYKSGDTFLAKEIPSLYIEYSSRSQRT